MKICGLLPPLGIGLPRFSLRMVVLLRFSVGCVLPCRSRHCLVLREVLQFDGLEHCVLRRVFRCCLEGVIVGVLEVAADFRWVFLGVEGVDIIQKIRYGATGRLKA